MPVGKGKSVLFKKLGNKAVEVFDKLKTDDTTYAGGELPPGIEDGVAQLSDIRFGEFEKGEFKGEPFFMAQAVCLEPEFIMTKSGNKIKCRDKQTRIGPEPLCETPKRSSRKTFEEHLDWVLRHLRTLGLETKDLKLEDLETACAALKQQKPIITFRTWQGEPTKEYPNPMTNHIWTGLADESYEPPSNEPGAGVEDETAQGGEPSVNGSSAPADEPGEDLDALATQADNGDADAGNRLTSLALGLGMTEDQIEKEVKTWGELANIIREKSSGGGAKSAPADSDAMPVKGHVYLFFPPIKGPGGRVTGKAKKAIECEVTEVITKGEKVHLKSITDKKEYKDVPWSDLTAPE